MGKKKQDTQKVQIPSFLREASQAGISAATDLFNQGPLQFFPGQTFAGFDPLQQEGFQSQLDFARNVAPGIQGDIFSSLGRALGAEGTINAEDLIDRNVGNLFNDPSVQAGLGTIESRANRNFMENVLPALRQQATGTGNQFSSKAEQSERLAGRDLQSAISEAQGSFLGDQLASARSLLGTDISTARGLQGTDLSTAAQLQRAALGLAPGTLQTGLFGGNVLGQVGAQQQALDQAGINEAMQRFNFGQQAPVDQVNTFINQLQGAGSIASGGMATIGQGQGSSPLSGAAGGALMGAQLGSVVPGLGTGIGAAAGAGLGLLGVF